MTEAPSGVATGAEFGVSHRMRRATFGSARRAATTVSTDRRVPGAGAIRWCRMTIPETGDTVTFSQEAGGVRARTGTISYLFPAADQPAVVAAYATLAVQARDHFGSRLRSFGEPVGEELTDEIARRVALDQAWLSQVNREPLDPRPRPWGQIVPVRCIVARLW